MSSESNLLLNPKKAALLSIIPGLGQLYSKKNWQGIIFFIIFTAFLFQWISFGYDAIVGLITLGSIPGEDNSLYLLVIGTFQIIIIAIFLVFYVTNIIGAYKMAVNYNLTGGKKKNKKKFGELSDKGLITLFTTPVYLVMAFTIVFPVLVTILISFTNYDFKNIPPSNLLEWVGFDNYKNMMFLSSYRSVFFSVFSWTIIWTLCATTLQIIIGIFTAVVFNQKFIKFKRLFGVIFLLPWAIPAFITIMSFSNMFNDSIGAINQQIIPFLNSIPFINIDPIFWKTDPFWTKVAIISIQGWLGFPYVYVMTTGVLQSIPEEMYEAARIDGAGAFQRFKSITFPMILFVAAPVFITQYTFNFNNFSVMYLFNEGGPGSVGGGAGSSDILISWIYKLTTGTSPQYSWAAAITMIVSIFVIAASLIAFKKTNTFGKEEMM